MSSEDDMQVDEGSDSNSDTESDNEIDESKVDKDFVRKETQTNEIQKCKVV